VILRQCWHVCTNNGFSLFLVELGWLVANRTMPGDDNGG